MNDDVQFIIDYVVPGVGIALVCILVFAAVYSLLDPWTSPFTRKLDQRQVAENEKLVEFDSLLGQRGEARTSLLPSGRAEINGEPVNVVTRGEPIDPGEPIEVVECRGNRVIVRRLDL